ncbi:MAG TPA: hypothetical protein VF306_20880 [Pirellulales bacterium]
MSYMFEVYHLSPIDAMKELELTQKVLRLGGRLDFREEGKADSSVNLPAICLTYEFEELSQAEKAAELLRDKGAHVEGPVDYGT